MPEITCKPRCLFPIRVHFFGCRVKKSRHNLLRLRAFADQNQSCFGYFSKSLRIVKLRRIDKYTANRQDHRMATDSFEPIGHMADHARAPMVGTRPIVSALYSPHRNPNNPVRLNYTFKYFHCFMPRRTNLYKVKRSLQS